MLRLCPPGPARSASSPSRGSSRAPRLRRRHRAPRKNRDRPRPLYRPTRHSVHVEKDRRTQATPGTADVLDLVSSRADSPPISTAPRPRPRQVAAVPTPRSRGSAGPRVRLRDLLQPVRLRLIRPWITLALEKHPLRHRHRPAGLAIVLDQAAAMQRRHARRPRGIQPTEVPGVRVRIDEGKWGREKQRDRRIARAQAGFRSPENPEDAGRRPGTRRRLRASRGASARAPGFRAGTEAPRDVPEFSPPARKISPRPPSLPPTAALVQRDASGGSGRLPRGTGLPTRGFPTSRVGRPVPPPPR